MYSVSRLLLACLVIAAAPLALAAPAALKVCADDNNLPFSNNQRQGFENKLAEMVARDLGRPLLFVWWPHSPMHAARIFREGICDLVMEVPSNDQHENPTRPYYSSSYVFVTRKTQHLHLRSFDDPQLRTLRIGLPVVGGDNGYVPAERELSSRGIIKNVVGYSIYGDFSKPNPPADLIAGVARGDVDVAIAWGPLAGYFAKQSDVALEVTPICPGKSAASPFLFQISFGTQRSDSSLREQLDSEILRRSVDIRRLLQSYGVPLVDPGSRSRFCQ